MNKLQIRNKLYKLRYNFGPYTQGETLQVNDITFSGGEFCVIAKIGKGKEKIPVRFIKNLDKLFEYMLRNIENVDQIKTINKKHYFRVKNPQGVVICQDYYRS